MGTSDNGAQMGNEPTYDVFLSFNSLDRPVVKQIADELKRRNYNGFMDQSHLQPGQNWVSALEAALDKSRSMALFVGQHDMGRWQQRERLWGLDRSTEDKSFRVVPVLLPGCKQPPKGFLKQIHWIDLRDDPSDSSRLDALGQAIRGEEPDSDIYESRSAFCPYRGLNFFREEDAEFFFGRDRFVERLVEKVKYHSLVAVVGASGSGKSSLVRAGLIPHLRKPSSDTVWEFLTMVPTDDPLASFARQIQPLTDPDARGSEVAAIRKQIAKDLAAGDTSMINLVEVALEQQRGTQRLLLLVDQWEELYSLCKNDDIRNRFIDELIVATSKKESPLTAILTVRDDFYGKLLEHSELMEHIGDGRVDLSPMKPDELDAVINEPARAVGLQIKSELVAEIRDDALAEPGNLAMLEFALERLWEKRSRGPQPELTFAAYKTIGKLAGAIATHADAVYNKLTPQQRDTLPGLFRSLVNAGASVKDDTRRRVLLSVLDETTRATADKLASERLLIIASRNPIDADAAAKTDDAGTEPPDDHASDEAVANARTTSDVIVEVAHEELLRRWTLLQDWIDDDREFLLWRSRLDLKVEEYQRDGAAALFQGRPLQESKQYYPARAADLEQYHRDFLDASLKSARQRMGLAVGGMIALLVVAAIIVFSWFRYDRDQDTERLIDSLLAGRAGVVAYWLEDLDNYGDLAIPKLHDRFSETKRDLSQRVHAVYALSRFDAVRSDEQQFLLDSIAKTKLPKDEGANLVAALSRIHERAPLDDELGRRVDEASSDSVRNRYLAVSLSLGITDRAEAICKLQEDPSHGTALIDGFKDFPGDIARVAETIESGDPALRAAICVAIGTLDQDAAESTGSILQRLYTDAKDGGTHSAAGWALQRQGHERDKLEKLAKQASPESTREAGWYVNSQGMTMLKVPGGEFRMGPVDDEENPSEDDEPETFKPFWISDREVTVGQFQEFVDATDNEIKWAGQDKDYSPTSDHPVQQVSWYDAVLYCNWLTAEENRSLSKEKQLTPYYELSEKKRDDESGPIVSAVVKVLGGKGYRLPTEKEWEYACRAISTQDYCYGNDPLQLPTYAVFNQGKTHVGGDKMPNGWGLFDMHGNVWEWCGDVYGTESESRVLRGGSFNVSYPQFLRSAGRLNFTPDDRDGSFGFRVSRTP
jgi:formylglycine-generating enzyme required for sulfatase activity